MACDTFSKIAQKCKGHFVNLQSQETEPFIEVILNSIMEHVQDLQSHQQHNFYEAVGYMVAAQLDSRKQEVLISKYRVVLGRCAFTKSDQKSDRIKNRIGSKIGSDRKSDRIKNRIGS